MSGRTIKVETPLDLYDIFITDELKKKHNSFPANWLFAPPEKEIGFRYAYEKFGKNQIFPIFFVFRSEPAKKTADNTSPANFTLAYQLDDTRSFQNITVNLTYQIDFYSNYMYEMNKFNMDYYRFQRKPFVEFDFSEYSVNFKNKFQVMFQEITANHTIAEMFDTGRYFRYTYRFDVMLPLFDVNVELPVERIVLGLYNGMETPEAKIYESTTEVKQNA